MAENSFVGLVRDVSLKGLGVVEHPDGRVFFVPDTWPDDRGRFEIVQEKKRYGFARLVELLEPSKDRVKPPCPHFGSTEGLCGGCPWMIGSYPSQLAHKQRIVAHRLQRAGLLVQPEVLREIWPSPLELGYRNRVQLKSDGRAVGFVSRGSHAIAPIKDCLVLTEKNRQTLKRLLQEQPYVEWQPADGHEWVFIEFDETIDFDTLKANTHTAFKQANEAQNTKMKQWLEEKLVMEERAQSVHELFCGSGNFTEVFAKLGFANIIAAESDGQAIEFLAAKKLAGVTPVSGNLYKPSSWNKIKKHARQPGVLFLDPPRDGFEEIRKYLSEFPSLHKILYVSCNLETFTRDLGQLKRAGWLIREIQPVDQFPQTPHIELMACLESASLS